MACHRTVFSLNPAFIGKTEKAFGAYDDVIQQFDVKESGGFPDFIGEITVGLAGL